MCAKILFVRNVVQCCSALLVASPDATTVTILFRSAACARKLCVMNVDILTYEISFVSFFDFALFFRVFFSFAGRVLGSRVLAAIRCAFVKHAINHFVDIVVRCKNAKEKNVAVFALKTALLLSARCARRKDVRGACFHIPTATNAENIFVLDVKT